MQIVLRSRSHLSLSLGQCFFTGRRLISPDRRTDTVNVPNKLDSCQNRNSSMRRRSSPLSSDWSINFQFKVSDQNNCHSIRTKTTIASSQEVEVGMESWTNNLQKEGEKNENSTRQGDDIHRFLRLVSSKEWPGASGKLKITTCLERRWW